LFKVKRIYLILPLYGRFWMLLKGLWYLQMLGPLAVQRFGPKKNCRNNCVVLPGISKHGHTTFFLDSSQHGNFLGFPNGSPPLHSSVLLLQLRGWMGTFLDANARLQI
jgi:hypothetical protein